MENEINYELEEKFIKEDPECDIIKGKYKSEDVALMKLKIEASKDVAHAIGVHKLIMSAFK